MHFPTGLCRPLRKLAFLALILAFLPAASPRALAVDGPPANFREGRSFPRLALKTVWTNRWVQRPGGLDFLLRFQEVSGRLDPSSVLAAQDSARAHGEEEWADETQFISILAPMAVGRAEPEEDGLLPKWLYTTAEEDLAYATIVAVYHNLHDHGVDWMLHDADGDSMCVWGYPDCPTVLLNISPWCPTGRWDGRVVKWYNGRVYEYDFGSTAGKTYVEWLCTVARQDLFLENDAFLRAFDGIQFEDLNRLLACWGGYKPNGVTSTLPDPQGDGLGMECDEDRGGRFRDETAASFDSILTEFAVPIRDAGRVVRINGHNVRWAVEPRSRWSEDPLYSSTFTGSHLENYGKWGGWPETRTGTIWLEVYRALEKVYGTDEADENGGWDVSTVQSFIDYDDPGRDQWTRLNLAQALMGDGFFEGTAAREDLSFQRFLQGDRRFAPRMIQEMNFPLGEAAGDYAVFPVAGGTLVYRQFRGEPGPYRDGYTVVVNTYEEELAGVPARDAFWLYGLHDDFPAPIEDLVFDHWDLQPQDDDCGPIDDVQTRGLDQAITLRLKTQSAVQVDIFDAAGRIVRTLREESMGPGDGVFQWDGRDRAGRRLQSGVYFYQVHASDCGCGGRIVLIR